MSNEWKLPRTLPDLSRYDRLAVDIETRDPDLKEKGPGIWSNGYIVGIAVGAPDGKRWYLPFAHEEGAQFEKDAVLDWARVELCRPDQPKIGANILYDLTYLYYAGVPVTGPFYDVQVAEPLLNENRKRYNLDSLALEYLGEGKDELVMEQACEARGWKGKPVEHLWRLDPTFIGPYAEADVDRTIRVFDLQMEKLKREPELLALFDLESRLIPLLLAMRLRGVRIDVEKVERTRKQIFDRLAQSQAMMADAAGGPVDCWAAESVAATLDKLKIEYPRTAKTGAPSIQKQWLETSSHPFLIALRDCRTLDKLLGTFIEGSVMNYTIDGRIHTQFHQLRGDDFGAVTGRFSSSNPNLQFIPKRDQEFGAMIRGLFIPEDGHFWGSADYSSVEIRILAHFALGPGADDIRQAFNDNPDIDYHQWCADMAGIPRMKAKKINFGVMYGMGQAKLGKQLNLDSGAARSFLNGYHAKLPWIRETMRIAGETVQRRARENPEGGFVRTILGRRRRFDQWVPKDWDLTTEFWKCEEVPKTREAVGQWVVDQIAKRRGMIEVTRWGKTSTRRIQGGAQVAFTHKAMNAVIQGSAADLMKKAMVDIWESGVCDVLGAPLLTIHDELCWSVPDNAAGRAAYAESVRLMETAIEFRVPIKVDASEKKNWGEA